MADIVEAGDPDRRRGGPGRAIGAVAVVALLALGVGVLRHRAGRHDAAPGPTASAAPSPSPEPSEEATFPEPPPLETDPPDDSPAGALPLMTGRTGLVVATGGTDLLLIDLDTGNALSPGVPGRVVDDVEPAAWQGGRWVVLRRRTCSTFWCGPSHVYVLAGEVFTDAGEGEDAWTDPHGGAIWVSSAVGTPTAYDTMRLRVERRSRDGRRIGAAVTLRPGERVVGVSLDGLVVSSYELDTTPVLVDTAGHRYALGGPGTHAVGVSPHRAVVAAQGCYVTEDDGRTADCSAAVVDTASARTGRPTAVAALSLPATPDAVALDPAETTLAVALAPAGNRAGRVVVTDLYGRVRTDLPGLGEPDRTALAWSPDGRYLVTARPSASSSGGGVRKTLVLWRRGWASPRRSESYDSPGFFPAIAVGIV
jgi:hypothetical protein